MFLRFQRIALNVSYGFGRYRSMFLIVVFLMKESVYSFISNGSIRKCIRFDPKKEKVTTPQRTVTRDKILSNYTLFFYKKHNYKKH